MGFDCHNVEVVYVKDSPKWTHEKPFFLSDSQSYESEIVTNFEPDRRLVTIKDIRPVKDSFQLDVHGFCIRDHHTGTNIGQEGPQDCPAYASETIDLLKETFACDVVICYDVRRRSSTKEREQLEPLDEIGYARPRTPAPPVSRIHADHTIYGGFQRAKRHFSDQELETYLKSGKWRLRIVNTWRPLKQVSSSPLAIIDYRTVALDDLLETDTVNTEYVGENYCVKYNPNHRFYWLSEQKPDELTLFVTFDSLNSLGCSQLNTCPHTAFELPWASISDDIRESIETRCFVITPL